MVGLHGLVDAWSTRILLALVTHMCVCPLLLQGKGVTLSCDTSATLTWCLTTYGLWKVRAVLLHLAPFCDTTQA